ncbi:S8 family peptidase [Candidatus Soleaferrea massiliensis]|uniref:S8 family peptidase n=1 Tax=Candidatus Soleaferrea massiliensis TaxID=1470354 RepID=UPI0018CCAA46|nr:S8/S53 family peptidase [Candidatus Soleaferrea massiliensis]
MIKWKYTKIGVSLLLIIALLSTCLLVQGAGSVMGEDVNWRDKISEDLLQVMETAEEDEKIPVYVWTTDIDYDQVEREVEEETGLSRAALQEEYQPISDKIRQLDDEQEMDAMLVQNSKDTKAQRFKEQERMDRYITNRRDIAQNKYAEKNNNMVKKLAFPQEDILYASKYSPMIIVRLKKGQIEAICKNRGVERVRLYVEQEGSDSSSGSVVQSVEADYTKNTMGYDGSGVKIGMVEEYLPSKNYHITSGKVTHVAGGRESSSHHALNVACTILNTAPGAHIYATGIKDSSITQIIEKIEVLLAYDVSIINISWGLQRKSGTTSWYAALEEWLDHICSVHEVTVVVAAGNAGYTHSNIDVIGLAYNVITVGAINDNDTGNVSSDDFLDPGSSYNNGGTAGCAKPDVMAPGNVYGDSGTSYAAPVVTGVIAQMQECRPALKSNTRIVKAVLTAGCDRKVPGESMGGLTAIQGAGVINARKSMTVLTAGRYAAFHFEPNVREITKNINITSADEVIRIAYAWTRTNYPKNSHNVIGTVVAPYIDVNMYVYKPNGSEQGRSAIPTSSAELLHFIPNTYGTYRVKLTRSTNLSYKVWGALAWY